MLTRLFILFYELIYLLKGNTSIRSTQSQIFRAFRGSSNFMVAFKMVGKFNNKLFY